MIGGIRRILGFVKVTETSGEIRIQGIPSEVITRDIAKIWNTKRINKHLFNRIGRNDITFYTFFALEVHYMLQQVDEYKFSKTSRRVIKHILAEMEENTWLKQLTEEVTSRVDSTQLSKLNANLFPHQDNFVTKYGELVERYNLKGYLLSADPGTGKAQPLDAFIRIPGGWKTMGEMKVGTKVIAQDGSITEVTGVYPQGEKQIYRVTFADGRNVECCGDHLWTVHQHLNGSTQQSCVVDTKTILNKLANTDDACFHVPLINPEELPSKNLPIDPYEFGTHPANKFIPSDYLSGSIDQRLSLLQGLMDANGTVDAKGSIVFGASSRQLSLGVQRLVWSLGGIAEITAKGNNYRTWIEYRNPGDLFRLADKKQLISDYHHNDTTPMLRIKSVEPIDTKPAQCIMIDHPDHLYVTDNYVATHNTIMGLALAECLKADLIIVVSPKNAVKRVWAGTVDWLYKKPQKYWLVGQGVPYKRERIIITHFEGLNKVIPELSKAPTGKVTVILDESHNLNEIKSARTKLFLDVCKRTNADDVLWSSGTPLKAMGYEMIPYLRSTDPLFTSEVEAKFMKVFGRSSDRARGVLRNRIGKVSFHVAGTSVVNVEKKFYTWKIKIPNAKHYTLDSIREQMQKFVADRLKYYKKNFKQYRDDFRAGIQAYEAVMNPNDKKDFKMYRKFIKEISKGYDPKIHKEKAKFVNVFELKKIIPSITDKQVKDGFKNARSVIKYPALKVLGEALGGVVGKARSQCQLDMIPKTDWDKIAEMSEKKVLVFTSYVNVVKAIDKELKSKGYKTLLVYGETNKNVAGIVDKFDKDDSIKFLIATFPSLSTAVPVTMADMTVFTNTEFRSNIMDQAEARTARLGQDTTAKYITTLLDTGKEPNISTRSKDIMEWSKDQVKQLTDLNQPEIAESLNKGLFTDSNESLQNKDIFPMMMGEDPVGQSEDSDPFETVLESIDIEDLDELGLIEDFH